jgi:WD40 repeat protein
VGEKMPADLYAVAFSPMEKRWREGTWLATCIYGTPPGRSVERAEGRDGEVFDIDFSPDGKQVAMGSMMVA